MDFKQQIALVLSAIVPEMSISEITTLLTAPPTPDKGDFAFACFRLAKTRKCAPPVIAAALANEVKSALFTAAPEGGYLNFTVDKAAFARAALADSPPPASEYAGATICIDYSSPNIAKPFHVAHIPSTVIGRALYNIYKYLGANVIGINHLGDWGTQFGKLICAYLRWGSETAVNEGGVKELTRLYVKFHDEAESDTALDDEARGWLVKMEQGDAEALRLWRWFSDVSLEEYKNNTYKRLGVDFDYYTGESFYNDKMQSVVEELSTAGLLQESGGAMIVELSEYNMPPCLILRSDGGTLYPTRDIAAAFYRKKTYNFDNCLYLTCMDQNLHFAQWFKVIELMGYNWASGLVHIPLGQISFKEGKLSTRKGNVVLLDDLLDEAVAKTLAIIEEKNPALENKLEVAEAVGVGAVVFNNMYTGRVKDVMFDWDRVLNFEGESGPYVQYTHARARGILEKAAASGAAGAAGGGDIDYTLLSDEYTQGVLRLIYALPEAITAAADKYEPYILSRALVALCQAFNRFYNACTVLGEDKPTKEARLALVKKTADTLKFGLGLLGITAPNKM